MRFTLTNRPEGLIGTFLQDFPTLDIDAIPQTERRVPWLCNVTVQGFAIRGAINKRPAVRRYKEWVHVFERSFFFTGDILLYRLPKSVAKYSVVAILEKASACFTSICEESLLCWTLGNHDSIVLYSFQVPGCALWICVRRLKLQYLKKGAVINYKHQWVLVLWSIEWRS